MDENEATTPVEGQAKKSNKDLILERLQKMFPDVDEETMYGKFMEFMDDMDRASSAHAQLGEKLTAHPKAALALADIMEGKHPAVAFKRQFSDDELNVSEDDEETYGQLLEAERERLADAETKQQMKDEYLANLEASSEEVQAFCEEKGITDEQFEDFIETCVEMTNDLLSGKLNTDLLNILWKGRNYDTDLANETSIAEERGRVSERNSKIEMKKKEMAGDGLPVTRTATVKESASKVPIRKSAWDQQ